MMSSRLSRFLRYAILATVLWSFASSLGFAREGDTQVNLRKVGDDLVLILSYDDGRDQEIHLNFKGLAQRGVLQIGPGSEGLSREQAEEALRDWGEKVDLRQVTREEIERILLRKAEEYKALLEDQALLSSGDPEVAALQEEAGQALRAEGAGLAEAERLLLEAKSRQEALSSRFGDGRRATELAQMNALLARVASLRFRYREAADLYQIASDQIAPYDGNKSVEYSLHSINSIFYHGDEMIDNNSINDAIDKYLAYSLFFDYTGKDYNLIRAKSIHNLSLALSSSGRYQEAIDNVKISIDIYRNYPDKYYDLSVSIGSIGSYFSDIGMYEDSVSSFKEAIEILINNLSEEELLYSNSMAILYNNIVDPLLSMEEYEDAFLYSSQSLEIYRKLYNYNPNIFNINLLYSVINHANVLNSIGLIEESLNLSYESLSISRNLYKINPEFSGKYMASSLHLLSNNLLKYGKIDEAIKISQESLNITRGLSKIRPDVFEIYLSMSLNNMGDIFLYSGDIDKFKNMYIESISILNRYRDFDKYKEQISSTLNNYAIGLLSIGEIKNSLKNSSEALSITRELYRKYPMSFKYNLSVILNTMSVSLIEYKKYKESIEKSEESISILRGMSNNINFHDDLAGSLNNLANGLFYIGDHSGALYFLNEAENILINLNKEKPKYFEENLSMIKINIARKLYELNMNHESLKKSEEAIELFSSKFFENPSVNYKLMISAVQQYILSCRSLNIEPDDSLILPIWSILENFIPK